MTWSAPRAFAFSALSTDPDGGDDGAADGLGNADRDAADAGAAGVDQHRLAGLQPGVVEQHMLDRAVGDRDAPGVPHRHAGGNFDQQTRGMIDEVLGESVNVKAAHSADVLTQIVAPLHAGGAVAAGQSGIRHDAVARCDTGDIGAHFGDLAGRLGPNG